MQVSFTEGLRLRLGDTSLFLTIACEPLNIVCGLHWRAFIGGLPLPLVRRAPTAFHWRASSMQCHQSSMQCFSWKALQCLAH